MKMKMMKNNLQTKLPMMMMILSCLIKSLSQVDAKKFWLG